jgi:glutamate racemase
MIGFFDSGHGGLTILHEVAAALPRERFVYLGDHANAPYGGRSGPEIYELTRRAVERLFGIGCGLVILACNTASAIALRRLQQQWLPHQWPDRRVLGVVVPTIEAITGVSFQARHPGSTGPARALRTVGIFATPATVRSEVYPIEIAKRAPHIRVVQQSCGDLVRQIEGGASRQEMAATIALEARELEAGLGGRAPDAIVLGCTHFPLVRDLFEAEIDCGIELVSQPRQVALALADYLARHPEFASGAAAPTALLTTGDAQDVSERARHLFGMDLEFVPWPR